MLDKQQLNRSYDYCEAIIKENSRSFYLAFSKLPEPKNKAIFAIYAFCRQADDAIDNARNKEEQISNLLTVSRELTLFLDNEKPNGPIWDCLADVFETYDMNKEGFYLQIKGQKLDIDFEQPETLDELIDYSYHVASSVGLMLLPIVAKKNHELLKKEAIYLGIAMQITNILRDIGEDYHQLNRIYLPKELMRKFNVSEEMIKNKETTHSFVELWEYLAQLAKEYYACFYKKIELFDEDSRYQLLVAARLYERILDVIRKDKYSCLTKKNKLKKKDMLKIVIESKKVLNS